MTAAVRRRFDYKTSKWVFDDLGDTTELTKIPAAFKRAKEPMPEIKGMPEQPSRWTLREPQRVPSDNVKIFYPDDLTAQAEAEAHRFVGRYKDRACQSPYVMKKSKIYIAIPWHLNIARTLIWREHTRAPTMPVIIVADATTEEDFRPVLEEVADIMAKTGDGYDLL